MKKTNNLFVCDKVEFMTLPNFKSFNCSKCQVLVGMTKSSYEGFLKIKNIKVICHKCFEKVIETLTNIELIKNKQN